MTRMTTHWDDCWHTHPACARIYGRREAIQVLESLEHELMTLSLRETGWTADEAEIAARALALARTRIKELPHE